MKKIKIPEVSVVIPVYNGEKYIKDAVNSVLNQTFKDFEIIIVNDASTDNTEKVIFDNFKKLIEIGKIHYLKNNKNKGRNISGNIGAKKAKGKYLFFLDADDLWKNYHIERNLDILQKENADIVFARPRIFIDEKGNIKRVSKSKIERDIDKIIFSSKIGFPSATAFNKSSFLFYNPEFKFREDIELFIRARLKNQKIRISDTNSVLIREHNSKTRMSKTHHFYEYTLKLYDFYKDKIPPMYLPYFIMHVADVAFKFGDFKTGYKMMFNAVKKRPSILLDRRILLNFIKRGFRIDRAFLS